ncbi:chitin synthase [Ceratobasidium sp. AG-Ba]|nr:chitin synthase [Ceratobasidium sp. AG-Ba]
MLNTPGYQAHGNQAETLLATSLAKTDSTSFAPTSRRSTSTLLSCATHSMVPLRFRRMNRPGVRQAWQEKFIICMLIFGACAGAIFYIIIFGKLLCPQFDKAWNPNELAGHAAENDYWIAVRGNVYYMTKFRKGSHSDIPSAPSSQDVMTELWGQDLREHFPIPLTLGCPGLVPDPTMALGAANSSNIAVPTAMYAFGALPSVTTSKLAAQDWYTAQFLPTMELECFYKGTLDENVYDLSDYFYTIDQNPNQSKFEFLSSTVTDLFKHALAKMSPDDGAKLYQCMKNLFYVGKTDFHKTAKCQFSGILLLCLLGCYPGQLTGELSPEAMDKRRIGSLAALKYDDKRKLLFLICDGNIIGSGNDRPIPRIALDILGVDPALDPEPPRFKNGKGQLNYGRVCSGLYEFEGHVVP